MSLALAASCDDQKKRPAFRAARLVIATPFTALDGDWLQVRKTSLAGFDVINKSGQVHASMQLEICDEPRLLESLGLFNPIISSMRSIQTLPDTSILDTRLAYGLFSQTVSYGPHCQGLRRIWVTADGHQAWAHSSNESHEAEHRLQIEPASLQSFSPILIDRACQLIGLLVNTSPDRRQGEIFVANEIDQVEMALSNVHDSIFFESYASFELVGGTEYATAVGQVFTFDQHQRLVAVFRGFRMRRMKQRTLEHLVQRSSADPVSPKFSAVCNPMETLPSPLNPKGEDDESLADQFRKKISAIFQTTLGIDHTPTDSKVRRHLLRRHITY
jgi:hypothetical protein